MTMHFLPIQYIMEKGKMQIFFTKFEIKKVKTNIDPDARLRGILRILWVFSIVAENLNFYSL